MSFTTGIQLSIELSQIFGTARQVISAGRNLIDFSRQLRKSGSDIVVEEDLADVFGRTRISQALELDFKKKVLASTAITPLHGNSEIQLHAGVGPTVDRAFRDRDRRYISTVIQLSMLCWLHDRTELASAISECLSKRVVMNIDGANPSPGLEGILATLEACASQTNQYAWNTHFERVRYRIWQALPRAHFPNLYQGEALDTVPAELLLAAMDCLCLVQSLPEDRVLFVPTRKGIIPLIVWAHDLLGLTVVVEFRGENVQFGIGVPQVIIRPHEAEPLEQAIGNIALLDKSMDVIFTYVAEENFTQRLQKQERHPLRGIANEILRRHFNWYFITEEDSPLYDEAAQSVVEFAMIKSLTLRRVNDDSHPRQNPPGLESWRILDAARIVFNDVHLGDKNIECNVRSQLANTTPLKHKIRLPPSLNQFVEKMMDLKDDGQYSLKYWDKWSKRQLVDDMIYLAALILIIAHVKEAQSCADLPILMDMGLTVRRSFIFESISHEIRVWLGPDAIFYDFARMIVGPSFQSDALADCFLISDFGWSVHLSCCDDCDPADVRPEMIYVRQGVPTNANTGERKQLMMDFPLQRCTAASFRTLNNKSLVYKPRCEMPVIARKEFFSNRIGAFLLDIRFESEAVLTQFSGQKTNFYITTSYRRLHNALWPVYLTRNHIYCPHDIESSTASTNASEATLYPGTVTVAGYLSRPKPGAVKSSVLNEFCLVVLAAGDPRTRWLAIEELRLHHENRLVMLRTNDCCENCALAWLKDQKERWGEWALVL